MFDFLNQPVTMGDLLFFIIFGPSLYQFGYALENKLVDFVVARARRER